MPNYYDFPSIKLKENIEFIFVWLACVKVPDPQETLNKL